MREPKTRKASEITGRKKKQCVEGFKVYKIMQLTSTPDECSRTVGSPGSGTE